MNRRDLIKTFAIGTAAGSVGWLGKSDAISAEPHATPGKSFPPLKITKVRTIQTAPQRTRLVVVKVEWFNVRSAWYGPADLSPVGHAANIHLDLAIHNFGIQEGLRFNEASQEVFPGCPTIRNGYFHLNEAPGWGVDINEEAARKYPYPEHPGYWEPVRRRDGTAVRP